MTTAYVVQLESGTSTATEDVWIDWQDFDERTWCYPDGYKVSELQALADKSYEDTVAQYPHRKVRIVQRETTETIIRRSFL